MKKVGQKLKGRPFAILSVSLDKAGQKKELTKFVEENKMDWTHIYDEKGWESPIAKTYKVVGIPSTFLLDEKGNILRVNLRGAHLLDLITQEVDALEARMAAAGIPTKHTK